MRSCRTGRTMGRSASPTWRTPGRAGWTLLSTSGQAGMGVDAGLGNWRASRAKVGGHIDSSGH